MIRVVRVVREDKERYRKLPEDNFKRTYLSDTETTSGPGDRGEPSLRSKSILLTEVLVVGSMETERGGGEGTYPDDMGEQANVGPRSRVPSELIKEAERPLKR